MSGTLLRQRDTLSTAGVVLTAVILVPTGALPISVFLILVSALHVLSRHIRDRSWTAS